MWSKATQIAKRLGEVVKLILKGGHRMRADHPAEHSSGPASVVTGYVWVHSILRCLENVLQEQLRCV